MSGPQPTWGPPLGGPELITCFDEATTRRPFDTPREGIVRTTDRPYIHEHFFILRAKRRDDLLGNPARILRLVGFDIDDHGAPRGGRARDNPRLVARKWRGRRHFVQRLDERGRGWGSRRRSRTRRILDERRNPPDCGEPRNAGNEQPEHKWIQ